LLIVKLSLDENNSLQIFFQSNRGKPFLKKNLEIDFKSASSPFDSKKYSLINDIVVKSNLISFIVGL